MEDRIYDEMGEDISAIAKVAKINQKDHAQGHICPNTEKWLSLGTAGLLDQARTKLKREVEPVKRAFYESATIVLQASIDFMGRYADLAEEQAAGGAGIISASPAQFSLDQQEIARICRKLTRAPAETFREAIQSLWFLYVILQMESNASSFSPGRADQYLYPFYRRDVDAGTIEDAAALEIIEALWLKFNQIVYLRNTNSARYFAGFPIGFNVAVGGQNTEGECAANELSYLMLQAQAHVGLPQPNLSARLFSGSAPEFVAECTRVIGLGSGMPQVFNDDAVIPALVNQGISREDAVNYAIVGCVELTTHGNNLGWSDAAMFNMVKALELALNDGVCLLTGGQIGPRLGSLDDHASFEDVEVAFQGQIDYFIKRMIPLCHRVEQLHAEVLPSAFLSSVIDDCVENGIDVTAGGAHYNLSGIQAIQVANIADSLAALKTLVYGAADRTRQTNNAPVDRLKLLAAMREDFAASRFEALQGILAKRAPKYGNDVEWVDRLGAAWIEYFAKRVSEYTNARGGPYHTGLYTVSAHVPMGQNVGATPDGRRARRPLADGGISAVYGRDTHGPTSVLNSVARIPSIHGSNGTLLNLKFLPRLFESVEGRDAFSNLLCTLVKLGIIHAQFNVVRREDLLAAKADPDRYSSLPIRVAGYTAYFTELAPDLQDEIIARTEHAWV